MIKVTQEFLSKNQHKRTIDGEEKTKKVVDFQVGNYNRPPNKLAGLYRDPLIIVAIERPDIITVKDLISNKVMKVHTSRLRLFRHPANMGIEEISALAAVDLDEFYDGENVKHVEKIQRNGDFEFVGKDMNLTMILGSNGLQLRI